MEKYMQCQNLNQQMYYYVLKLRERIDTQAKTYTAI